MQRSRKKYEKTKLARKRRRNVPNQEFQTGTDMKVRNKVKEQEKRKIYTKLA